MKISKEEQVKVVPEGYIDSERNTFVVTNYQECVDAGIMSYKETVKSIEETELHHNEIRGLLKKYKPNFPI